MGEGDSGGGEKDVNRMKIGLDQEIQTTKSNTVQTSCEH